MVIQISKGVCQVEFVERIVGKTAGSLNEQGLVICLQIKDTDALTAQNS